MNIPSILRHWFTLAATAVSVWLVARLTLSAHDADALTEAFGKLVEPLIVIVTLLIAALWRLFLTWAAKTFRTSAGEDGHDKDEDSGGGLSPCVVGIVMAAAFMGAPSSSAGEFPGGVRATPIASPLTALPKLS